MDSIAAKILDELLGRQKELPSRHVPRSERQPPADHWTRPILLERAAYLAKMARYGQGSANEIIKEYSRHAALLCFHSRDSDAEVDESSARILYVLDGRAALVTGGTRIAFGTIQGGVAHRLHAGDVVHIPAGQSHQIQVDGENTVTCLVLKIQETP